MISSQFSQQQIHAQQIPGAPPQSSIPGLGLAGQLGAFAGPIGLPHGHQALGIKAPQDLHRDDIKVPLGPSAEERLVKVCWKMCELMKRHVNVLLFIAK